MTIQPTREIYIPKNSTEIRDDEAQSVAYIFDNRNGKPSAIGFAGKAQKPSFHYYFQTAERRDAYVAAFFKNQRERIDSRKARAKARSEFVHSVKVGDVFYTSWGYDQTNVEYFQVVALRGAKQILVREIAKFYEEDHYMSGESAPRVDDFLADSCALGKGNPPKVCTVRGGSYGVSIKICDTRTGWPLPSKTVGTLRVYETRRESHYA